MLVDSLLFERLHQATRLAHRRLERQVDIYRPNVDVHNYRRLLQGFWGFYQPLERKLAVLADHNLPSSYSQRRRKAPRLEQDLLALRMTETEIAALPLCGRLPAIPTLPQVFGVLYVIDGAALSERIATIHLAVNNLGISPSQGGSFFSSLSASYDSLDTCRQDLIEMAEAVEKPDHQDLVIQSAMDTLECLE
ncbi:MAG TPA: biliverdin-producing heme oxygenase, partial [Nitrospira sp.]|nr:biliverdin-producing heme oxygenase [Nitrospira sp.]